MGYLGFGMFVAILLVIILAIAPFIGKMRRGIYNVLENLDLEDSLVGKVFVVIENEDEEEINYMTGMVIAIGYLIYLLLVTIIGLLTIVLYPLVLIVLIGGFIFKTKQQKQQ